MTLAAIRLRPDSDRWNILNKIEIAKAKKKHLATSYALPHKYTTFCYLIIIKNKKFKKSFKQKVERLFILLYQS